MRVIGGRRVEDGEGTMVAQEELGGGREAGEREIRSLNMHPFRPPLLPHFPHTHTRRRRVSAGGGGLARIEREGRSHTEGRINRVL